MYKNYLEKRVESFEKLPMSCKELFFKIISKQYVVGYEDAIKDFLLLNELDYSKCKDGIEIFFNFAYDIFEQRYKNEGSFDKCMFLNASDIKGVEEEFSFAIVSTVPNVKTMLLIGLHGYDEYARTGKKPDVEKDKKLKARGFDIVRFSEREVFSNVFACVIDAVDTFDDIAGYRKKDD